MNKFLSNLAEGLAWAFITPEEARRMLRETETMRGLTWERREQGAFAKAA
jgi:hypothetical protein